MTAKLKEYSAKNRYSVMLFGLMIVLLLFFSATKGEILWSLGTWNGIFMQFPEFGIMTIGVMFCFIIGSIDMSFVALGDFACILAVDYMGSHVKENMSNGQVMGVIVVAIIIALVVGAIGGIINGALIAYLNIPPVMATIAMSLVWLGLSTAVTKGYAVTGVPELYTEIGHTRLLGILPVPLILFLFIFIVSWFLLRHTTYGKKLYMTGTNIKAAKFSAINTKAMIIGTFILCDVISTIGCLVMVSTMNSAKADYGTSYVMRVILILVLAGVLPDGGMGKIFNVLLSIVAVQIIASGVNMFPNLNSYYASLIWGGLLIVVLIISTKMNGDILKLFRIKKQKE